MFYLQTGAVCGVVCFITGAEGAVAPRSGRHPAKPGLHALLPIIEAVATAATVLLAWLIWYSPSSPAKRALARQVWRARGVPAHTAAHTAPRGAEPHPAARLCTHRAGGEAGEGVRAGTATAAPPYEGGKQPQGAARGVGLAVPGEPRPHRQQCAPPQNRRLWQSGHP